MGDEEVSSPSGRKLRDVAAWAEMGLPVSTSSTKAARLVDLAIEMVLGVFGDPYGTAMRAAEDDKDFALPVCVLLWLKVLGTSGKVDDEGVVELRERAEKAINARPHSDREKGIFAAVCQMSKGRMEDALSIIEVLAVTNACDATLAKLQNDLCYFLGQKTRMRDTDARTVPLMDASTPMYGYVLGMYAFALEECEDFQLAMMYAQQALTINKRDVWAIHATAHVYEMQGKHKEAIEFLETCKGDWTGTNLTCHNYWHLGLALLELGRKEEAMKLYDEHIAPCIGPGGVFALVDSSQFLQRMELEDIDVGPRWQVIVDPWFSLKDHHRVAFNDFHLAVVAAVSQDSSIREGVAHSLRAFTESEEYADTTSYNVLKQIGLPVLLAAFAFRDGRYAECVSNMFPIRYKIQMFGGSTAQRDLLTLLMIHSCIKAGDKYHKSLASQLLQERLLTKKESQMSLRLLAQAKS